MDADAELAALQSRLKDLEQRAADRKAGVAFVKADTSPVGNPYRGDAAAGAGRKGWPEPYRPTTVQAGAAGAPPPESERGARIDPHIREKYSSTDIPLGAAAVAPRGRVDIPVAKEDPTAPSRRHRWQEEIDGAEAQVAAEIDADYRRYCDHEGIRHTQHVPQHMDAGGAKTAEVSDCGASAEDPSVPTPKHGDDGGVRRASSEGPQLVLVGGSDATGKATDCSFVVRIPNAQEPVESGGSALGVGTADGQSVHTGASQADTVPVEGQVLAAAAHVPEEEYVATPFHAGEVEGVPGGEASVVTFADEVEDIPMEHLAVYCGSIGMDPHSFPDSLLLWIARQGLRAPLPAEWCSHDAPDGCTYYIHTPTGATQWAHPLDPHYATLFKQHKLMLIAVLEEFDALDNSGWSLPLPMTDIVLVTDSFLSPKTFVWLHKSWAVGDMEYPGEPVAIHVEEIPIDMIRDLAGCSVSPAQPGMVTLRSGEPNETGALVQTWLEIRAEEDELYVLCREHSVAPACGYTAMVPYGAPDPYGSPHTYATTEGGESPGATTATTRGGAA